MQKNKNRLFHLGVVVVIAAVILACNVNPFAKAEKQTASQTATTPVSTKKPAKASAVPTRPRPTEEVIDEVPTLKPTVKKKPAALPTAVPANSISSFDGDYNGVKYSVLYPGDFTHTSSNGWELFCLATDKSLCVTVHPRNGNWTDAKALADEVMGQVREKTSNMVIYDEKSTTTNMDGFPAYWMGASYTYKGVDIDSSNLFVVVQHIGFEIAADGAPQKVEAYRRILDSMMNSFQLLYD
jgi:hypothetical protein